jgi:hypothetical protein
MIAHTLFNNPKVLLLPGGLAQGGEAIVNGYHPGKKGPASSISIRLQPPA